MRSNERTKKIREVFLGIKESRESAPDEKKK